MTKRERLYFHNQKASSVFYGLIPRLDNSHGAVFNISGGERLILADLDISKWLNATTKPQPLVTSKEVLKSWEEAAQQQLRTEYKESALKGILAGNI